MLPEAALLQILNDCHESLSETIAELQLHTATQPASPEWDKVRDEVSALVSIADVMKLALDAWLESRRQDGL